MGGGRNPRAQRTRNGSRSLGLQRWTENNTILTDKTCTVVFKARNHLFLERNESSGEMYTGWFHTKWYLKRSFLNSLSTHLLSKVMLNHKHSLASQDISRNGQHVWNIRLTPGLGNRDFPPPPPCQFPHLPLGCVCMGGPSLSLVSYEVLEWGSGKEKEQHI